MSDKDLAIIKQWMELSNELIEGLCKRSEFSPVSEWERKVRTLRTLAESISVIATDIQATYLYICLDCGRSFDHLHEDLQDYHKNIYSLCCPYCKSRNYQVNEIKVISKD